MCVCLCVHARGCACVCVRVCVCVCMMMYATVHKQRLEETLWVSSLPILWVLGMDCMEDAVVYQL